MTNDNAFNFNMVSCDLFKFQDRDYKDEREKAQAMLAEEIGGRKETQGKSMSRHERTKAFEQQKLFKEVMESLEYPLEKP